MPKNKNVISVGKIDGTTYDIDIDEFIWDFYLAKKHVPTYYEWPETQKQFGSCCGLYALNTGLKRGFPNLSIPPARKEGRKGIESLRHIAKQQDVTKFGEIFSVDYFTRIIEYLKIPGCTAFKANSTNFIRIVCRELRHNKSVIIPTDVDVVSGQPKVNYGNSTHWALAFGYGVYKGTLYILVTQYDKYYAWPAKLLENSNRQLPTANPRSAPGFGWYKEITVALTARVPVKTKMEFFSQLAPEQEKTHTIRRVHVNDLKVSVGLYLVFQDHNHCSLQRQ